MATRWKKITGRFYATPSGGRPVREWLLALPKEERRSIGQAIQKVEFGWPIGMPYCRSLGHGLREVRADLSGGRIARVVFWIAGSEMILLHGFERQRKRRHRTTSSLRAGANGRSTDEKEKAQRETRLHRSNRDVR